MDIVISAIARRWKLVAPRGALGLGENFPGALELAFSVTWCTPYFWGSRPRLSFRLSLSTHLFTLPIFSISPVLRGACAFGLCVFLSSFALGIRFGSP